MPNKANAWKALRQTKRRTERNKQVRDRVSYLRRKLKRTLEQDDATAAVGAYRDVQKVLDRAAGKGILKANTVSRLKARAAKKLKAVAAK